MIPISATPNRSTATVFPLLLARYLAGQIAENTWQRFMNLVDSKVTTEGERMALARFFHELTSEQGPEVKDMPQEAEIEDILAEIRSR